MLRITDLFPSSISCPRSYRVDHLQQNCQLHLSSPFHQAVWHSAKLILSVPISALFFHHCQLHSKQGSLWCSIAGLQKVFDSITYPELLYILWSHACFQAYMSKHSHLVAIRSLLTWITSHSFRSTLGKWPCSPAISNLYKRHSKCHLILYHTLLFTQRQ